jgi:ABC-2 type transport system ATP-binding protein
LPGVTFADRRGEAVVLSCADSDKALGALLLEFPMASNVEVHGAGLEEAFLDLVGEKAEE